MFFMIIVQSGTSGTLFIYKYMHVFYNTQTSITANCKLDGEIQETSLKTIF